MSQEFTAEQTKRLELAEKLFRVAGRSPAEAAEYTARAMKILEELNVDMSVLEQDGGEKAKRADELHAGGRYKYQRELWSAIAKLHFCFYWNQYNWDAKKVSPYHAKKHGMAAAKANLGGYVFQHRIVGRRVNCVGVRNMAGYLEQTIERLTKEHLATEMREERSSSPYAISFRQGIAEEVIAKIYDRREEQLSEERRKEHEAAERAARAGSGEATGTAVTLSSITKQEHEANYDFMHGDGAWARKKAAEVKWQADWDAGRAERARKAKEEEEAYTQWAAANPKEAAKQEREAEKGRRSRASRTSYREPKERDNRDHRAYEAGRRAGREVSIDLQADKAKPKAFLS